MKSNKKLSLRRETLTELATDDLRALAGGDLLTVAALCMGGSGQTCGYSCGGDCCSEDGCSVVCCNTGHYVAAVTALLDQ